MANRAEWQCRNCGEHPMSFNGDKPSSGGRCPAGTNHVWMRIPEGTANSRDWQCINCGAHPTGFSGKRPSSSSKCPATGFKHVWTLL